MGNLGIMGPESVPILAFFWDLWVHFLDTFNIYQGVYCFFACLGIYSQLAITNRNHGE